MRSIRIGKMVKLDDKSTVPLFALLISLPTLIGGIFWLSNVASLGEATAKTVNRLESAIYRTQEDVAYMRGLMEKQNKKQSKED